MYVIATILEIAQHNRAMKPGKTPTVLIDNDSTITKSSHYN